LHLINYDFMQFCRYAYRRGLRRCSFNYQGDARASMRGTSDKKIPTLFRIMQITIDLIIILLGGRGTEKTYDFRSTTTTMA
jgi:hypothetical protein